MDAMQMFGWVGIVLVNVAYFPQIVKTVKLKKAWQISPLFYGMIAAGICSYLVYAVWRRDPVFIVSNTVGLIQPLLMIYFSLKWGRY
jgi:MtN3 and saliva related transmembrane protein